MNRITYAGNFCEICHCPVQFDPGAYKDCPCDAHKAWERLRQYEDTGLGPEEYKKHADDVAPVVNGQWIIRYDGPYGRRRVYCSACENHSGIGGIIKNQKKPYCPNCGAKMDLEDT